ncbi:MAG TPA: hypothetical protein VIU62_12855 [Chloroflexota bacterium]
MNTGQAEAPARRTRFSDVCGTIDEVKRLLHEEPEASVVQPQVLEDLIDDALFMEARMEVRLQHYQVFREQIIAIAEQLRDLGESRRQEAIAQAAPLKAALGKGRPLTAAECANVVARAEAIRAVAQHLEDTLGRYKTLALTLERAYRVIQGSRSWVLDEDEARAKALPGEAEWLRWLPPSPHRERIIHYLRAGRAHLLPSAERTADGLGEQPPLVQFEDGGVMPLPAVRWAAEVRNFHPVEAPPHPDGRRYRGQG